MTLLAARPQSLMSNTLAMHDASAQPRILVVDGSKVTRKLIEGCIRKDLPNAEVYLCGNAEEARQVLDYGVVDLITTALRLPDADGIEFARYVRESAPQAYIPIIVVSGDVQERLASRSFTDDVTDYFDKALGFDALAAFISGYVRTDELVPGTVLYVEDSRVVAVATRRMLEKHGLKVQHKVSAEEALEFIEQGRASGQGLGIELVLTDVYLKGGMTGHELLVKLRGPLAYGKAELPVLVMTGDDNRDNQRALIREGANDLVQKPIEERLLITKLRFQLKLAQLFARQIATA